jgi:flagellar motility protein MotE (MotC chaperone)
VHVVRLKKLEVTTAIDNDLAQLREHTTTLFELQDNENGRLRQYVQGLKQDEIQLQLKAMHRKIAELEGQIGND